MAPRDEDAVDKIFSGCLENLPPLSSKVVRIFTSSTFTDMLMERNTLMEWVYPKIKEYCKEKHGLEFQVRFNGLFKFQDQIIKVTILGCGHEVGCEG